MKICGLLVALLFLYPSVPLFSRSTPRIDLEIETIQIQPDRPDTGTPVVVVAGIRNLGSEETADFSISVKVRRRDKIVKGFENVPVLSKLPRLGSGLSVPVDIGILEEGRYQIEVAVDPDQRVAESNEDNNRKVRSFRVWSPTYRSVTYGFR